MWQLSPPTLHRHKHILRVICWATPPATPLLWCGLPLLALPLDQLLPPSLTSCHFGLSSCVAAWAAVTPLVIHSFSLSRSLCLSHSHFFYIFSVFLFKNFITARPRKTVKRCCHSKFMWLLWATPHTHTHAHSWTHTHMYIYTLWHTHGYQYKLGK